MSDDLRELQRANPVGSDELRSIVALDGESLLGGLERKPSDPRVGRLGFAVTGLAVAAGLSLVAFFGVRFAAQPAEPDVIGPAAGASEPDQSPASTVDAAGGAAEQADPSDSERAASEEGGESETDESAELGDDAGVAAADGVPAGEGADPAAVDPDGSADDSSPPGSEGDPAPPASARPTGSDAVFDRAVDLLAVHHSTDPDDTYSTVASRELATWAGVSPLVVVGPASTRSKLDMVEVAAVMNATWGGGWLSVEADGSSAVSTSALQWVNALDDGGQVWIAEGGPSAFTADVLREVISQRPTVDTRARIHVVQHSELSEARTTSTDLAFVQSNTDYRKIDDGNEANDTADLKADDGSFGATALAGRHSTAWAAAFAYTDPDDGIDFSDTVAVLEILGIGTDLVRSTSDFADEIVR